MINTPVEDAHKEYIGNAACHGRLAAVFAQLIVAEESPGVHTLVVPLRDQDGRVLPGIRKAITREVNRLCDAVRQQAGALVDAFGIPDAILAAPIGLKEPVGSAAA